MINRLLQILWIGFVALMISGPSSIAAPYAAMVMDARTGKVLHSRNADTKLHPASLTKMMTLYVAFEAIERGEISLDTYVTVSRNAASEPPSKLGLRAGQKIKLRYLVRAAAVKSANDAATAIGEAISGSEKAFTQRMTRTAKALGMRNTVFKNAHGLTQSGHWSTARDMTILGRHVIYDYPAYYNLFSRIETSAKIATVRNTNRRLLNSYKGADGIKTGYTRAAGFNLVASAERGRERVIATVFGGKSTTSRNARVAELLNMGFERAPTFARLRKPRKPAYVPPNRRVAAAAPAPKTIRVPAPQRARPVMAVKTSLRPQSRPVPKPAPAPVLVAAKADDIQKTLAAATVAPAEPEPVKVLALTASPKPLARPLPPEPKVVEAPQPTLVAAVVAPVVAPKVAEVLAAIELAPKPTPEPAQPLMVSIAPVEVEPDPIATVIKRSLNTGSKTWGIHVGTYSSKRQAERVLLRTALAEMGTLDGASRKVHRRSKGYDAKFTGLTQDLANLACQRLNAQRIECLTVAPS